MALKGLGQQPFRAVTSVGALADRPAATSVDPGDLYYATDTGLLYRTDGATWTAVTASGSDDDSYPAVTVDTWNAHVSSHFVYQWGNRLYVSIVVDGTGITSSGASPTSIFTIRWPTALTGYPLPTSQILSRTLALLGDPLGDAAVTTTAAFNVVLPQDHSSVNLAPTVAIAASAKLAWLLALPSIT